MQDSPTSACKSIAVGEKKKFSARDNVLSLSLSLSLFCSGTSTTRENGSATRARTPEGAKQTEHQNEGGCACDG